MRRVAIGQYAALSFTELHGRVTPIGRIVMSESVAFHTFVSGYLCKWAAVFQVGWYMMRCGDAEKPRFA